MSDPQKMRIMLDLDQTIISAEANEEYDAKKNKQKAKKFTKHNMDDYYIVFERPGVQEFLDYLFANFIVGVWTAASKDYAIFVINNVILKNHPERKLDYIFFSYHCDISKDKKTGTKDLSMLWDVYKVKGYTKKNTIILDDYKEVHKTQPGNCVRAPAFEFTASNSHEDTFLKDLVPHLDKLGNRVANGGSVADVMDEVNAQR